MEKYDISFCSNCKFPVLKNFLYCPLCGQLMPWPITVEGLDVIEKSENKLHNPDPNYYHIQKSVLGWRFCSFCGKKLRFH